MENNALDDLPMEQANGDASYADQISESFSNFIAGWILLILTVTFMYMVEDAVVKFAALTRRAQMACRFVKDNMVIDPDFDGRVVLVKGICKLRGAPTANSDTQTGFKADTSKGNVIRMSRVAEMYQWVEHEHKRKGDGGRRKRSSRHRESSPNRYTDRDDVYYTYSLEWCEVDHDSSMFHGLDRYSQVDSAYNYDANSIQLHDVTHSTHRNPPRSPDIRSMSTDAAASVGAYALTERQVKMMVNYENCVLNTKDYISAPNKPSIETDDSRKTPYYYLIYKPANASRDCSLKNPEVGLLRVRYEAVYEEGHITTVGVQQGSTFRPFTQEDSKVYDKKCLCLGGSRMSDSIRGPPSGLGYRSLGDEEDPYGNDEPSADEGWSGDNRAGTCCICCLPCQMMSNLLQKCVSLVVGNDILLLEERWVSIKDMFKHASNNTNLRVMILRLLGMLLMWLAISLIFDPISTLLSFIPLIGGMAQSLFGLLTGILALLLGTLIISAAWVSFHPEALFTILLGMGAVCVLYGSSEPWETAGYVIGALSLYPAMVYAQNWVNERAFAAGQAELDRQHATALPHAVPVAIGNPLMSSTQEEKADKRV